MVLERLVHLALALEDGGRYPPGAGIGIVSLGTAGVGGCGAVGPEPDGDELGRPLRGVDAALGVECVAVGARVVGLVAATLVGALAGGFDIAIGCEGGAIGTDGKFVLGVDGAAAGSVEGHGVLLNVADTFEDVDFSVLRP